MKRLVYIFLFVLALPFVSQAQSGSKLYINVGSANLKKSLMALPAFQYLGSKPGNSQLKLGNKLFTTLFNDLSVSSYFRFIPQDAFLEDATKTALTPKGSAPNGFDFGKWRPLGTEFLIRAGYKVVGSKLSFEAYLYYIPKAQTVLAKTYEGRTKDVRAIAHKFANDIVYKLTGKKGIFTTKLVVGRTSGRQQKEIFVLDYDGQNPIQVTNHRSISFSPSWAPDGKSILYSTFNYHKRKKSRNADLMRYDLTNARRWVLSYRKGINSGGVFFPDMSQILLRISNKGVSDLFTMSVDGKKIRPLTNGPRGAMNVEPSISPDGQKIVFSSDRSSKPMIYVMDKSGRNIEKRTYAGRYNSTPVFSPDGKKIAFAGHDKGKFDVFMMDTNGTNMVRLTSARKKDGTWSDNESPSFSPDGRHIVFTSNRSGYYQLYLVNVDGTNERRITFDTHDYFAPRWSPYMD